MRFRQFIGGGAALGLALAVALPGVATAHDTGVAGFVYTETNAASGNAVMAYARTEAGGLEPIGPFASGGLGTGSGLATQGEVVLANDGRYLLAVNAGSNDVSVFRVRDGGRLTLTDREWAQGTMPVSVTAHGDLVYVLDAGGAGNIAGFRLEDGRLTAIAGSVRALSGSATNPAEVGFSSNGRTLVVTERATSLIDTYRLHDGRPDAAVTTASSGPVPYGFAFDNRDHLVVSEAANSTLSSYRVGPAGASVITASIPTFGLAACWVAITPNGRLGFDTNAHSGTISSFAIGADGSIALDQAIAANTGAGSAPLDLGVTSNGHFLFGMVSGAHAIAGFRIGFGGTLSATAMAGGLPASASGIAVS